MENGTVLHVNLLSLKHALCVGAEAVHLVHLVLHGEAEHSHGLVFHYCAFLVDAASSLWLLVAGVHLVRHTVDGFKELAFLPHCNQF